MLLRISIRELRMAEAQGRVTKGRPRTTKTLAWRPADEVVLRRLRAQVAARLGLVVTERDLVAAPRRAGANADRDADRIQHAARGLAGRRETNVDVSGHETRRSHGERLPPRAAHAVAAPTGGRGGEGSGSSRSRREGAPGPGQCRRERAGPPCRGAVRLSSPAAR